MTGPTWRGWSETASDGTADVRSSRLTSDAQVTNRWFPKVRSWFALGAPLELLSPLSVMRVLFLLATVGWPLAGLAPRWHGVHLVPIMVTSAITLAVTVLLSRLRALTARSSLGLVLLWCAAVSVLTWSGGGTGRSFAYLLFFFLIDVFVAMFFRLRIVVGAVVVETVGAALSLGLSSTIGAAIAASISLGTTSLAISLAVAVLVRSAQRQKIIDPDTGLPNGFGLARELVGRGGSRVFVVSVISLDGLGAAREALGYQVGTELLRRAVEDLGQVLPAGAVIGRVEGDELVVTYGVDHRVSVTDAELRVTVIPDQVADAARELAVTLGTAVEAGRYLVNGLEVSLHAHVGSAVSPWDGADVAELIRRASNSARAATAQRQAFATWRGDVGVMTANDLAMLSDLRLAGERHELWLAYQPQVAAATGRTVAVEALLRWDSLQHGSVPPAIFIPLAEKTGLIDRITEWVLVEALDAQTRWRASGVTLPVSVNLSAKNLTRPDLAEWILAELASRGLPHQCLVLEVTETAAAVDLVLAIDLLRPLHDSGVRISIDDFGVGYTSLSILPRLPLDELKVDQSFVMASPTSAPAEAIVRSVRAMAHLLGLTVVAEGVETDEIRSLMVQLGFDLLQGYFFARPMPESELLTHLREQAAIR